MPVTEELRALHGHLVRLSLDDGSDVEGTVVGTLEAADGLVVVLDRADRPGTRFSCNYQAIRAYREL